MQSLASADSATCDGQPILTGFPSSFSMAGVAELSYNGQGTVLQKGRGGKALHIVHIKINDGTPEGIMIQINRWLQPTGLTSTTASRPSCQGPRTPAKLRSTSSSLPCRALLTSASEVTSSLTRTETCEETCGRTQTPCAPYLRSDGQSSAVHLP